MADVSDLADEQLREALTKLGVDVGPITATTRNLYREKLRRMGGAIVGVAATGLQPPKRSNPIGIKTETVPCLNVVERLWNSFDNPQHVSSDVAIVFPDGELCFINRGIAVLVNEQLINLFYNLQEPFPINVVSLIGSVITVWVRSNESGLDLKEKISLKQGIPINTLRLIYNQLEIMNNASLSQYQLSPGSNINLCLIAQPIDDSPYPVSANIHNMNPFLSVSHLKLNFPLVDLLPSPSPQQQPRHITLNSQIQHILHVYNIPSLPFKMFMGFLYSGHMPTFPNEQIPYQVLIYGCCAVIGNVLNSDLFVSDSLHHLKMALKTDQRHLSTLIKLSEDINFPALKTCCHQHDCC